MKFNKKQNGINHRDFDCWIDIDIGWMNSCYFFLISDKRRFLMTTPRKTNMEPPNEGLVQMIFLFHWVIFSFHVNFPGCKDCLDTSRTGFFEVQRHNQPFSKSFFVA